MAVASVGSSRLHRHPIAVFRPPSPAPSPHAMHPSICHIHWRPVPPCAPTHVPPQRQVSLRIKYVCLHEPYQVRSPRSLCWPHVHCDFSMWVVSSACLLYVPHVYFQVVDLPPKADPPPCPSPPQVRPGPVSVPAPCPSPRHVRPRAMSVPPPCPSPPHVRGPPHVRPPTWPSRSHVPSPAMSLPTR